jgi:hypothetical protein
MIAASQAAPDTLITFASWVVLVGSLCRIVRGVRHGRRRRDEQLWRQWTQVRHRASAAPGRGYSALGQVRRHRQRARRGLKAYVFWPATGEVGGAWFWHRWPPVGAYVLARGSWGPGEHHNENVFYVHEHELEAVVDGRAPAAWERHERRLHRGARPAPAVVSHGDGGFQRQPERPG